MSMGRSPSLRIHHREDSKGTDIGKDVKHGVEHDRFHARIIRCRHTRHHIARLGDG